MNYILPISVALIFVFAIIKDVPILDAFIEGAVSGLKTIYNILPILMLMLTAIYMFRSSGGIDLLIYAVSPLFSRLDIPGEVISLAAIKPFSGSGALAVFDEIVKNYGPDSFIGRFAAILCASTETTFYTLSVYLGNKVKQCGRIVFCAVAADITALVVASFVIKIL